MSAQSKNLTFHPDILKLAEQLMELRHFGGNLSAFLSQLLREEWERRQSPMTFATPTGVPISQAIVEAVAQLHDHGLPAEGARKPASAKRSSPSPKRKQGGRRRPLKKGVPKDSGMS